MIDANGNGKISRKEFMKAIVGFLKSRGYKVTKADRRVLRGAFKWIAKQDKKKGISKNDWEGFVSKAWEHVDANGNGTINACELENAIRQLLEAHK